MDAIGHVQSLGKRVGRMAGMYNATESEVRKAIRETMRAREQAARQKVRDDTRQHRDESWLIRDRLKQQREAARESARAANQQRQAMLGVSRGIGNVGNAAASAAASVRGMMTFGAGRVAGGVGGALGSVAQVMGSIIGPTERIGQTVSSVIGGSFSAAGKIVGAFGDLLGLTISGASVAIGKLGGSILGLIPLVGPALAGIIGAFGELGGVIGSVVGGAFRVFGEILGGVGKIAGEVAGGLVSALVTVGTSAVAAAVRFEQTQLAFAGMLGSADKAKSVLGDLFDFAARTPFSFEGVTQATQRLLAFGFSAENAVGIMKRMADVAAAMPEGLDEGLKRVTRAIGEMQAKGRVSAQEMRQLADAGIPVWDALATRIGVSVPRAMKMAENNILSARDGIMALLDLASSPRFAGMADKLGKSLGGMWATLKDNASLALRDLGVAIIDAFDLKGVVGKLSELFGFLRSNIDSIKPALVEIGTVFRATFDIGISMVKLAVDALKDWSGQVGGAPREMQTMRDAIIDAMEKIGHAVIDTFATMVNEAITFADRIKNLFSLHGPNQVLRGSPEHKRAVAAREYATAVADATAEIAGNNAWKGRDGGGMFLGGGGLTAAATRPDVFARIEARAAAAKAALDALPAAAGQAFALFDPTAAKAGLTAGLNVLRNTSSALRYAQLDAGQLAAVLGGPMAQGFRQGLVIPAGAATGALSALAVQMTMVKGKVGDPELLKFGQFGSGIEAAIDKTNEFGKKLQDIHFQFRQLIPHEEMVNQIGVVVGAVGLLGSNLLQAKAALNLQAGQVLRDMREKFGPKNVDVAAMQKGSQEAASAINRAINDALVGGDKDPAVEELKAIKAAIDEQNRIQERQGQRLLGIWAQVGLAGVGP